MSPFEAPDGPYTIEKVMESIRSQIVEPEPSARDAGDSAAAPQAPAPLVDDGSEAARLAARVGLMCRRQSLKPDYRIRSHRPVVGRLVDLLKKLIHWGASPYTDAIRERQEAFNESAVEAVQAICLRLAGVSQALHDHSRALQDLVHTQQRLLAEHESLASMERELESRHEALKNLLLDHARETTEHFELVELAATLQENRLRETRERQDALAARHDLLPFFEAIPDQKRLETLNRTRGPREEIALRQAQYLKIFKGAPGQVLDVGCGRGELLEMLRIEGLECWGAEIDPLMIAEARKNGVHVVRTDALSALRSASPATLGGLFAAQVVEHFFPGELLAFLRLARERLAPGAAIVLETVNPLSLAALTKSYFSDLDHKQPINPEYLKLLLEMAGFVAVELHYLMPFREDEKPPPLPPASELGIPPRARDALQSALDRVNGLFYGMQDYYVAARQPAPAPIKGGAEESARS